MYQIISIPLQQTAPGKVNTEMLKATIFNTIANDFDTTMKITEVLNQPVNFNDGNAWARTSKFNSACQFIFGGEEAICRKFELKPEKKVHVLIWTDKATNTTIHGLQILIPVQPNKTYMSEVSSGNMSFMTDADVLEQIEDHFYSDQIPKGATTFAQAFTGVGRYDTEEIDGPLTLVCYDSDGYNWKTGKLEARAIDSILYVGEGHKLKVYHRCGGKFTDDSMAFFEIYDSEYNLLHSGVIGNQPYDFSKDDEEEYGEPGEWKAIEEYMMKHYGIDVNADNVYGVSHM